MHWLEGSYVCYSFPNEADSRWRTKADTCKGETFDQMLLDSNISWHFAFWCQTHEISEYNVLGPCPSRGALASGVGWLSQGKCNRVPLTVQCLGCDNFTASEYYTVLAPWSCFTQWSPGLSHTDNVKAYTCTMKIRQNLKFLPPTVMPGERLWQFDCI